jgi:hypothetical protein
MTLHHPGDVLGRRYQLAELLVDAGTGGAWLAHDKVLGRSVSIHEVPDSDARAEKMRNAARAAAMASDPRLLRVLDFDVEGGTLYVVSEWGAGLTLNHAIAQGPLNHERAARMAEHLARAMTHAHSVGVTHGRLAPENVLVDDAGEVRIVGTAIEAAMLGLPRCTVAQDTADVVGLLYAALTGRWAGRSESTVPTAPRGPDGAWLRVRQVRANVPAVLDDVVARVQKPGGSLGDLQATLATWLGVHVEAHAGDVTTDTALDLPPVTDTGRHVATPIAVAPEPRQVARRDPPMPVSIAPPPEEPGALPGTRWMQIALAAAMALFLIVGVFFAFQLGRNHGDGGSSSPKLSFSATDFDPAGNLSEHPDQVKLALDGNPATAWTTMDYKQQLGPGGDKPGLGLLLDLRQRSNVNTVQLTLLGDGSSLSVYVLPDRPQIAASVVGNGSPVTIAGAPPAGVSTTNGTDQTISLPQGTVGRYVVVWFTQIPNDGRLYRGGIAEVNVTGTPAP